MNNFDIKKIREQLGVSQEQFAEMIGVHTRTVQNWEAGSTIPASKHAILRNIISKHQKSAGGEHNIDGDHVNVSPCDRFEKLVELLNAKEAALVKAQEHIDKLLEIIANLTKRV